MVIFSKPLTKGLKERSCDHEISKPFKPFKALIFQVYFIFFVFKCELFFIVKILIQTNKSCSKIFSLKNIMTAFHLHKYLLKIQCVVASKKLQVLKHLFSIANNHPKSYQRKVFAFRLHTCCFTATCFFSPDLSKLHPALILARL